jgi:hypothetical protein
MSNTPVIFRRKPRIKRRSLKIKVNQKRLSFFHVHQEILGAIKNKMLILKK